jgi:acyl-CoA thioester hydrolase
MSLSHIYEFTVPASAIDVNGHVNNVAFVQWMQDAAIAHADAVGCTAATRALNATWVVRSHEIQYRLPAFLGEVIHVKTWVVDCRMVSSRRKYEFIRPRDQALLARGQTDWVLIDLATLHPVQIPIEIQNLYHPTQASA